MVIGKSKGGLVRKLTYRLIVIALLGLILVPAVDAGRKVKKTGKVADGFYTDGKYSFKIKLDEEWKVKVKKAGQSVRFIMTEKNFLVPVDYIDAPDYTKVPRIVLIADTTSINIGAFIDSLLSETYESEQKKEILREFEILFERDLIPRGKKRFKIAGQKAYAWKALANYTEEVATSSSAIGGKRVYGKYGGAIIGVKKDDLVILFHVICEYQYFKDIYQKTLQFANSIEWAESEN